MRKFEATIRGVTPFLANRYLEAAEVEGKIGKTPRDSTKLDAWRKAEGALRMYENGHGPYLPSRNIRSAMVEGARALQLKHKGGAGRSVALFPFLRRGLVVEHAELLFGEVEIGLHRDTVRIPPQKGALVIKYWPKIEEWSLTFQLVVFDDSLQEDAELQEAIRAAGLYCGLGTGRPDFGKFNLVGWKEQTLSSAPLV